MKYKGLLLDFGGVIADEGYREGLYILADKYKIDRIEFFKRCADLIYDTGYIIGKSSQKAYIKSIEDTFKIKINKLEFEKIIIDSFKIRKSILDIVTMVREQNVISAILSDQTDWLDRLNEKYDFFRYFDFIFNSYYIGMGKRDRRLFRYVADKLSSKPEELLFIDDQQPNIDRALIEGLNAVCLTDVNDITGFLNDTFLKNKEIN